MDAPPARRPRMNRDLLAALTSGFVGALALFASLYNVYLQRQQVRAAVWPRLAAREELTGDDYKLFLANHGVGSAIVKRFRVRFDGELMRSWGDLAKHLSPVAPPRLSGVNDVTVTLSPGGESTLLETDPTGMLALSEAGTRLRGELCYCSSLDDCWNWTFDFADGDETDPVSGCPADPVTFHVVTAEEKALNIRKFRERLAATRDAGGDAGSPSKN